jgi:Cu(I)/Ag(I) efflux system periplasmic protein CusF
MKLTLPTLLASLFLALPATADMGHTGQNMPTDHGAMTTKLSEGVVRKVDKAQKKLTIRHGPLENLGMPSMTMVFRVKDAAYLDQVKPGDNILFQAESVNGFLTVTQLEMVKK